MWAGVRDYFLDEEHLIIMTVIATIQKDPPMMPPGNFVLGRLSLKDILACLQVLYLPTFNHFLSYHYTTYHIQEHQQQLHK